jgi:hypothetical protein
MNAASVVVVVASPASSCCHCCRHLPEPIEARMVTVAKPALDVAMVAAAM